MITKENLLNSQSMIHLLLIIAIGIVLLIAIRIIFKKRNLKDDRIHRRFLRRLFSLTVILICLVNVVEVFNPTMDLRSTLWKGSALIVAILGFAGQTAIGDMICGFLISINKPFEIGDRIIVEGMEPGTVVDITLRHTVIMIYDEYRVTIPNSELNSKTIINTTKGTDRIGILLTYSVSYDTDVELAMEVIRDCVVASPYTLSVERNGITEDSGPVYFLKYGDSAIILETTIWIPYTTSFYIATTDMNLRVNKAFREHGIEIPYNFVNIVERDNTAPSDNIALASGKKKSPSKRHFRTDTVIITPDRENLTQAIDMVRSFASMQRLDEKARNQLALMTEELIGLTGDIVGNTMAKLWIEGSGLKYRIHLNFKADIGSGERIRLLSLSSSGRNEANNSLPQKIWEKVIVGLRTTEDNTNANDNYEWSMHDNEPSAHEIAESILVALADDIRVSVTKTHVELTVVRSV